MQYICTQLQVNSSTVKSLPSMKKITEIHTSPQLMGRFAEGKKMKFRMKM